MPAPRSHLRHSSDLIVPHPTRPPTEAGAFLPTGAGLLSVTDMLAGRSVTHITAPRSVTYIPAPPIRRQAILPVCPGQVIALRFSSWSPVHAALKKTGYDDSPDLHYAKGARPAIVLRCAVDELNDAIAITVLPIASFGRKKDKKNISWALQDYVLRARQADDQIHGTLNSSVLAFDGTIPIHGLDCSTSWVVALPCDIIAAGADIWSIVPYYDSVINKNSSTTKKAFVSEATLRALIKLADKNRDTLIGELKKNTDFAESVRYEMYLSVLPPGHPIPPSKRSLTPLKATHYHNKKPSTSFSPGAHGVRFPCNFDAASPRPRTPSRRPLPPIPAERRDHVPLTLAKLPSRSALDTPKGTPSLVLKQRAPSLYDGNLATAVDYNDDVDSADADFDKESDKRVILNAPRTPPRPARTLALTPDQVDGPRTPPKRTPDTPLPSRPSKRRVQGKPPRGYERSPSPTPVSRTPRRETQLASGLPRHTGTMLEAMERLHARDLMQRVHPGDSMEKIPILLPHRSSASKARPLQTPPSDSSGSLESNKRGDHSHLKIADIVPASSGSQSATSELSQPAATSSTPEPESPVITQTLAEACSSFAWAQPSFSASTTLYVARPSLASAAEPSPSSLATPSSTASVSTPSSRPRLLSSTDERNLQKRKSVSAASEISTKRLRGAEEESARGTTA